MPVLTLVQRIANLRDRHYSWEMSDIALVADAFYNWICVGMIYFDVVGSSQQLLQLLQRTLPYLISGQHSSISLILNLQESHWVALVVICRSEICTAFYADSFGPSPPQGVGEVKKKIGTGLSLRLIHQVLETIQTVGGHLEIVDISQCQQKDGSSCAVFALANVDFVHQTLLTAGDSTIDDIVRQLIQPRPPIDVLGLRRDFANAVMTMPLTSPRVIQDSEEVADGIFTPVDKQARCYAGETGEVVEYWHEFIRNSTYTRLSQFLDNYLKGFKKFGTNLSYEVMCAFTRRLDSPVPCLSPLPTLPDIYSESVAKTVLVYQQMLVLFGCCRDPERYTELTLPSYSYVHAVCIHAELMLGPHHPVMMELRLYAIYISTRKRYEIRVSLSLAGVRKLRD